jgi:hypothetical protein
LEESEYAVLPKLQEVFLERIFTRLSVVLVAQECGKEFLIS